MNTPHVIDSWNTLSGDCRALIIFDDKDYPCLPRKGWVGLRPGHRFYGKRPDDLIFDKIRLVEHFRDHVFPACGQLAKNWWLGFTAQDSDTTEDIRSACESLSITLMGSPLPPPTWDPVPRGGVCAHWACHDCGEIVKSVPASVGPPVFCKRCAALRHSEINLKSATWDVEDLKKKNERAEKKIAWLKARLENEAECSGNTAAIPHIERALAEIDKAAGLECDICGGPTPCVSLSTPLRVVCKSCQNDTTGFRLEGAPEPCDKCKADPGYLLCPACKEKRKAWLKEEGQQRREKKPVPDIPSNSSPLAARKNGCGICRPDAFRSLGVLCVACQKRIIEAAGASKLRTIIGLPPNGPAKEKG